MKKEREVGKKLSQGERRKVGVKLPSLLLPVIIENFFSFAHNFNSSLEIRKIFETKTPSLIHIRFWEEKKRISFFSSSFLSFFVCKKWDKIDAWKILCWVRGNENENRTKQKRIKREKTRKKMWNFHKFPSNENHFDSQISCSYIVIGTTKKRKNERKDRKRQERKRERKRNDLNSFLNNCILREWYQERERLSFQQNGFLSLHGRGRPRRE